MIKITIPLKLLIFLFFLSNLTFGQKLLIKENVFTPESDENRTYNVVSCRGYEFPDDTVSFNIDGKIIFHKTSTRETEYIYNQSGLLEQKTEEVLYNSDGSSTKYTYDTFGNIVIKENYLSYAWESHFATEINTYAYENSLLISAKKYFTDLSYNSAEIGGTRDTIKTFYYYDSLKRMAKEEETHTLYPDNNKIYKYAYNNKNLLLLIKEYTLQNTSVIESIVYSYNKEGNVISMEIKGEKSYKETYEYLSGKLTEKKFPDTWSFDDKMIIYKYTYDDFGNVLTVNKYSKDGIFISTIADRKYKYISK